MTDDRQKLRREAVRSAKEFEGCYVRSADCTLAMESIIVEQEAEIDRLRYAAANALRFIPTNTGHEEACVRIIKEALLHD